MALMGVVMVCLQILMYPIRDSLWLSLGLACIIGLPALRFSTRDVLPAFVILHRALMAMSAFYLLAAYPAVGEAYRAEMDPASWLAMQYGAYVMAALAVIGMWRPSIGIFPILFIYWRKSELSELFGFVISITDYLVVLEFGLFLLIGFVLIKAMPHMPRLLRHFQPSSWALEPLLLVVLCAVAGHLANYFYSAVAKAILDANPIAWVLENNTHLIMMAADASKMLPIDVGPEVNAVAHHWAAALVLPLNIFTFAIQLFGLVALWRVRWAIITTVLYDVMHVGIFLLSGILFWKWMVLNAAIVVALATVRHVSIPRFIQVGLVLFVITSPLMFHTARLGWWDSRGVNLSHFTATTKDGTVYHVPSNYFLSGSISVAQQKRVGLPYWGHFNTGAIGNIYERDIWKMRQANRCDLSLASESRVDKVPAAKAVTRYAQRHHDFIVQHADEHGRFNYDWYPHHIWTTPWKFREFHALDKREIVSYRFVVQSGCPKMVDGDVVFEPLLEGGYDIPLEGATQ